MCTLGRLGHSNDCELNGIGKENHFALSHCSVHNNSHLFPCDILVWPLAGGSANQLSH